MDVSAPAVRPEEDPDGTASPRLGLVLAAGLVGGLLGWLGGESVHEFFAPATRVVAAMGGPGIAAPDGASVARASTRNSVLAFGLAGAGFGLCLGAVGGLTRGSSRDAIRGGAVGLALGGIAGAAAAQGLVPVFWSFWYGRREGGLDRDGMVLPLLMNAGVWSAIGAAGGLAFALGNRSGRAGAVRAAVAGVVGAAAGAAIFEVASALLFPTIRMMHPIPPVAAGRLLARLLLALGAALAIARAAAPRTARKPALS